MKLLRLVQISFNCLCVDLVSARKSWWPALWTVRERFVALYVLTFALVLPLLCYNMKNSLYFVKIYADSEKVKLLMENSERVAEAQRYLKMVGTSKSHGKFRDITAVEKRNDSKSLSVALTIITVSRNRHRVDDYEPFYLSQVVWRYLYLLHSIEIEGYPHDVSLSVCNVDHDPANYPEASNISEIVRTFRRFNQTHLTMVHPLEKEKQDYLFCLNSSIAGGPDYVMLVEDDALPTDDFFRVLDHVVTMRLEKRYVRGRFVPRAENVAYVKFFHPERLIGFWSLERERIAELISIAILLTTALTCVYVILVRWRVFGDDTHITYNVVVTLLFVYSFLVVAAIGRPNLVVLRRLFPLTFYVYTPAPSCCTPSMLFPREGAGVVLAYLKKITCENNFGKDSALESLVQGKDMKAYLIQPNTFKHIGLYSAVRERMVDPFLV